VSTEGSRERGRKRVLTADGSVQEEQALVVVIAGGGKLERGLVEAFVSEMRCHRRARASWATGPEPVETDGVQAFTFGALEAGGDDGATVG
jgi:predicted glycosyltransferase